MPSQGGHVYLQCFVHVYLRVHCVDGRFVRYFGKLRVRSEDRCCV
jgi:hypothetical protein